MRPRRLCILLVATLLHAACSFDVSTGWQVLHDGRYWQNSLTVPYTGEAQFRLRIQNEFLPKNYQPITIALCAKLNVQPVDRPSEWKIFCEKDAYFEFLVNQTANSTGVMLMRPGLYYLALGAWPLGNLSLLVSLDISAPDCASNTTGINCADNIVDASNHTISDFILPNNMTRFFRFVIEDSLSAFANFSFEPSSGLEVRARYLAAPASQWFDPPSDWGPGWMTFARPAPGAWFVAVSAANHSDSEALIVNITLDLLPVMCNPPQTNCTPGVVNLTDVSSLTSVVPSTLVQYYTVYNRNGSEFRVSITNPDGLNSSTTPSLFLKWGNLPAIDSWDAKDDGGPRLVKYIATNHTIEGHWFIAVWSDNIPRPYALWLYNICPNDCHEDVCIETGPSEGRCDCKDLVRSLDCAAQVPAALEWGVPAALLMLTALLVIAGAVHYTMRRRDLEHKLQYTPITPDADS